MKITVAMRVIGGFAIITLLLLIISLSSLFNINSIGSSVDKLNDEAVPALNQVSAIKVDILELGTVQLETFYDETLEQVEAHKKSSTNLTSCFSPLLRNSRSLFRGTVRAARLTSWKKTRASTLV
jgi:hypothetical protein